VSIVLWWSPLLATLRLALESDAHTHILLILPLSLALIYLDRTKLERPVQRSGRESLVTLLAIVGVAVLLMTGARGLADDVRLSLSMFALVVSWIGIFLFCFGRRALWTFIFPLCFLLWMVPIPSSALDGIIQFLQDQSAFAARLLFQLARVPVTQDGTMLSIPGLDIAVAPECSSIRSSLMLVITTTIIARLFLRSWWRKVLLVAAAIPLSVAKNGLRIFTIAELGTRVDPGYLDGRLHHHGGIVFLGISIAAVVLLLLVLRKTEIEKPAETATA